jgi:hypothetical protein
MALSQRSPGAWTRPSDHRTTPVERPQVNRGHQMLGTVLRTATVLKGVRWVVRLREAGRVGRREAVGRTLPGRDPGLATASGGSAYAEEAKRTRQRWLTRGITRDTTRGYGDGTEEDNRTPTTRTTAHACARCRCEEDTAANCCMKRWLGRSAPAGFFCVLSSPLLESTQKNRRA